MLGALRFAGFSLVVESRGYSPAVLLELFIAVAALVAEHKF